MRRTFGGTEQGTERLECLLRRISLVDGDEEKTANSRLNRRRVLEGKDRAILLHAQEPSPPD